jgi:hypothetical protein
MVLSVIDTTSVYVIYALAFVSGISERFIPDLISKAEAPADTTKGADKKPRTNGTT